ncbi:MAG TPA: hypothetical protein VMH20_07930 [Verrucomicrobiae bacterium]|nr:hypothetical protein [Verrucomicrobiae bacterium]
MESLRSEGSRSPFVRPVRFWLFGVIFLAIFLINCSPASAIPAFARKYGLPCSSCHEGWPKLSYFGQQFKDNGYQLGNDRDAPIFQQAAYWPVTFRITPFWSRESTSQVAVDQGNGQAKVTTDGFNWTGLDFHTGGTLAKNISFYVLPSSDEFGSFHFESVWARLDNVAGSTWLNFKMGKFELDNLLSEKRILTLSSVGGQYWNYHFQPFSSPGVPENYTFGIGDNQVGFEWLGHSADDRTRVSASILTSSDGNPDVPYSSSYDMFFTASRAFQVGNLGVQRIGGFAYIGQAPTYYQYTSTSTTEVGVDSVTGAVVNSSTTTPVAGTGTGNKWFERYGIIGEMYIKKYNLTAIYFRGHDSPWLGTDTAALPGAVLPAGAQAPTWNGALFESNYDWGPRLVLINRYELVRMSQQAFTSNPGNLGNLDTLTFGARYYPFINSRAGFAYHAEYGIIWQKGASPVTNGNLTTSSLLFGFDFDF